MQLFKLEDVRIDAVTKELLGDLNETANKINHLRPLSPFQLESIQQELVGERVYSSNAIEGNTFTLGETVAVLKSGYIDMSRRREATEIVNLGKAIEFVRSTLIRDDNPYTNANLLQLNGLILAGIDDAYAGRLRDNRVMITGARHQPPRPDLVYDLLTTFFIQLNGNSNCHPVVLASWAHWSIARIHPFFDGNGRVARLWQDLILFRSRLTCAIIPPESKREYLEDLAASDEGDFNPLVQLVSRRVAATFDRYIAAQQRADETSDWAKRLVGESQARAEQKRRLAYERWRREMEKLRYEFERHAATITHLSSDMQIQFKSYDTLEQSAWEQMRAGSGATKTSFFRLDFRKDRAFYRYVFFFGRHYWTDLDSEDDRAEPRVCLLVSEQIDDGDSISLIQAADDHPVTLKELFVVQKSFSRLRFAIELGQRVMDHAVQVEAIAKDFIQDVILNRMAQD